MSVAVKLYDPTLCGCNCGEPAPPDGFWLPGHFEAMKDRLRAGLNNPILTLETQYRSARPRRPGISDDAATMHRLRQEEHKTLQEVGELYNVTAERIRQILIKAGYPTTIVSAVPTERDIQEAWEIAENTREFAELLSITYRRARQIINERGWNSYAHFRRKR